MRQIKKQEHGDAKPVAPLRPGYCDECETRLSAQTKARGGRFCSKECKARWWSDARTRGGQVYALLMAWRQYRGRKGTPGAGAMADCAAIVDGWRAKDRAKRSGK